MVLYMTGIEDQDDKVLMKWIPPCFVVLAAVEYGQIEAVKGCSGFLIMSAVPAVSAEIDFEVWADQRIGRPQCFVARQRPP